MIDEVKLRKKKDEEINYMLSEPLQKAWTTFESMRTCDPVASMYIAHEMSNIFCQTSQNMVQLPPCSYTNKAWNSSTPCR
jgi:hypothetical protein